MASSPAAKQAPASQRLSHFSLADDEKKNATITLSGDDELARDATSCRYFMWVRHYYYEGSD